MPFAPIPVSTQDLVDFLSEKFGLDVTTPDLLVAADKFNMSYATVKKRLKQYKTGIGKWNLTIAEKLEKNFQNKTANKTTLVDSFDPAYLAAKDLVPDKDPNYVPFGNFTDLKKIIKSKVFYPTFITGLSGNGKTFGVEQACAQLGRDLIRVNITVETDEDDLIGGFRLVDGNTCLLYTSDAADES